MFKRLALIVVITIIHYAFTNGYEKAIIQQVLTNTEIVNRPREQCKSSAALQCQGMPSGHVECATIALFLLWSLVQLDIVKYVVALGIIVVALQRIIFKWHTLLQTMIGFVFGLLYASAYIYSPMLYYVWLFPIVYVIILVSVLERKMHNDPIPQWLSKDLYSIIWRKRDKVNFFSKMLFVSTISLSQTYTLYLDWGNLEKLLDRIVKRFEEEGIDIVIGIKSGGAIISDYIAHRLGVNNYYMKLATKCDKSTTYSVQEFIKKHVLKKRFAFNVCEDVPIDITGKRVLLVDESIGSGQTIRESKSHLFRKGAAEVFLATVEHWQKTSNFRPDELFVAAPNDYFTVWPWGYDN